MGRVFVSGMMWRAQKGKQLRGMTPVCSENSNTAAGAKVRSIAGGRVLRSPEQEEPEVWLMNAPLPTLDALSPFSREPEAIADEIWTAYFDSLGQEDGFSPVAAIAAAIRAARQEAVDVGYRKGRNDVRDEAEAVIWTLARQLREPELIDPEREPADHGEALRLLEAAALAIHELPDDRRKRDRAG